MASIAAFGNRETGSHLGWFAVSNSNQKLSFETEPWWLSRLACQSIANPFDSKVKGSSLALAVSGFNLFLLIVLRSGKVDSECFFCTGTNLNFSDEK